MNPKPPLACLELRFYNHNFVPDSTARAQMCYGGNPHLPGFLGLRFEVFHLKALCSIKMYPYFFAKRHNFPTLFPLYLDKHSHVLISLGFNHHRNQAALKGNQMIESLLLNMLLRFCERIFVNIKRYVRLTVFCPP